MKREADVLGESTEAYFARWKNGISNSELSSPLKEDVLSAICYNDYFGLGVILINIPEQSEESYVGDRIYRRSGDDTVEVTIPREISNVISRFSV